MKNTANQDAAAAAFASTNSTTTPSHGTTTTRSIPLSVSTAGEKFFVLENEAYHEGTAMTHSAGGKRHAARHQNKHMTLPDLTPSTADFSVIGKHDIEEKKSRIDESEWVVVATPTTTS